MTFTSNNWTDIFGDKQICKVSVRDILCNVSVPFICLKKSYTWLQLQIYNNEIRVCALNRVKLPNKVKNSTTEVVDCFTSAGLL